MNSERRDFDMVLFGSEVIKNRKGGGEFLLIIRRPVWQGLPTDSATSSGLGRAPHALQCRTPIQAPPGATRQAGLYTS
ncbi:hypothetical protein TNCV_1059701 [Trichonephila clavipes]|nr:hypothetical protein TNCV_1059701 [Trichonephila clavipes]